MESEEREKKALRAVRRRVQNIFPDEQAVVARLAGEEKLTIYWGVDPTGTEIHLGHTVQLLLLKELAQLGHDIVLLIGDFTARIGDPTGKHATRAALSDDAVKQNMATYIEQAEKILDRGTFRVAYNSEWLSPLTMEQVITLAGMVTVQQMLQRDMFQDRLKEEKPIHLNEFLYPLMQGYDSVALRTDGEVGGNDQTFNMLVGRDMEREILGKDKFVLATRLLADTATGRKMSKSEGTLIAVNDSPQEIRRKILAVDDAMVRSIFLLCTEVSDADIGRWQAEGAAPEKPREAKEALAAELVRMYHGKDVSEGDLQETISEGAGEEFDSFITHQVSGSSLSSVARMIQQGGVTLNEKKLSVDERKTILKKDDTVQYGKGRRFKIK